MIELVFLLVRSQLVLFLKILFEKLVVLFGESGGVEEVFEGEVLADVPEDFGVVEEVLRRIYGLHVLSKNYKKQLGKTHLFRNQDDQYRCFPFFTNP